MTESNAELQLKVWKELAISKQMLMRTATDALKLDPECSPEELKSALAVATRRAADADAQVAKSQEQAKAAIGAVEMQLADTVKALQSAEAANADALAKQEKLEQQVINVRANSANETNSLKERLAQKERELKAINTLLSDTPQNVVKKLKALKKDKMDEADARKRAEEHASTLRQEKKKLEQSVKDMKAAQDNAAKLAERYRDLHTLCGTFHKQLKPLVEDAKKLPKVPTLESTLLEGIEKIDAPEEKKSAAKGKRK